MKSLEDLDGAILESLIHPLTRGQFFAEHWKGRYLLLHGDASRFGEISGIAAVQDVASILRAYRSAVMVVGEVAVRESEGITDRFMVPPAEAARKYEQGATLEFDCAEMYVPELRAWVDALRGDLGLPEGTFGKAIVYASPRGSGLGAHFDAYSNFVLQLRGRKVWTLAPNRNVADPMEHYDLHEQPYVPPELGSYWQGEAPVDLAADGERVELRPGSLLFLPRGYWHSTEASDETLSVNITFSMPTWLDLLLGEVRRQLVRHAPWRELADGCGARDPARRAAAQARIATLLDGVVAELGALRPEDVYDRHTDPQDAYQITQAIFRQVLRL